MAASKYNSINKTSIKDITGDYISANSRHGGSYTSNYHKQLPKILMGSVKSGGRDIYISCDEVAKGKDIIVSGFIENEYLLNNLNLYYRIDQTDDFVLVERDPYSQWTIILNARSVYTSNSSKIELKLEGLDTQDTVTTVTEYFEIVREENCVADVDCRNSITEAVVDLENISSVEVFMIDINGQVFYAESLLDLKNVLLSNNIELEVYTKKLY